MKEKCCKKIYSNSIVDGEPYCKQHYPFAREIKLKKMADGIPTDQLDKYELKLKI